MGFDRLLLRRIGFEDFGGSRRALVGAAYSWIGVDSIVKGKNKIIKDKRYKVKLGSKLTQQPFLWQRC